MSSHSLGSPERPLRAVVVGSGPSGFYAAEALINDKTIRATCDVLDRLPTPYGLVRGGVAPDHQSIKKVVAVYEKLAVNPNFRFFGNVQLGRDVSMDDLRACYDVIIYAFGNEKGRRLGIPGDTLPGCHTATEFVAWYNGHPDYRKLSFNLNVEAAAVVGVGNVSMDVSRILARDPEELAGTDMAAHAIEALRNKPNLKRVYLLGRRGSVQAAFSPKEIHEIAMLKDVDLIVSQADAEPDEHSKAWLSKADEKEAKEIRKNLDYLAESAKTGATGKPRQIILKMCVSPAEVIAGPDGHTAHMKLEKNAASPGKDGGEPSFRGSGQFETIDVGAVFMAIGYLGTPVPGVPYDAKRGVVPNAGGRVLKEAGSQEKMPGEYVVGWAKRGPSGLIGTNRMDSVDTVKALLEDIKTPGARHAYDADINALPKLLAAKKVCYVTFQDWKKLDALELENGKKLGKVRDKFTDVGEMLKAMGKL